MATASCTETTIPVHDSVPSEADSSPLPPSFSSMCADIRNEIYRYMTPIDGPTSDYQGLFLSCRQIKGEMEVKCIKIMTKLTESVKKNWSLGGELLVLFPKTYTDLKEVAFRIPSVDHVRNDFYLVSDRAAKFQELRLHIHHLLSLYLNTSVIKPHDRTHHDSIYTLTPESVLGLCRHVIQEDWMSREKLSLHPQHAYHLVLRLNPRHCVDFLTIINVLKGPDARKPVSAHGKIVYNQTSPQVADHVCLIVDYKKDTE